MLKVLLKKQLTEIFQSFFVNRKRALPAAGFSPPD